LEKALFTSPEFSGNNSHTQFLDSAFVPSAANGDFRQAVVTIVKELERLVIEYEQRIAAPVDPGPQTSPTPAMPNPTPAPQTGTSRGSSDLGINGAALFGVIIGLTILAGVIYLWSQFRRAKRFY